MSSYLDGDTADFCIQYLRNGGEHRVKPNQTKRMAAIKMLQEAGGLLW